MRLMGPRLTWSSDVQNNRPVKQNPNTAAAASLNYILHTILLCYVGKVEP